MSKPTYRVRAATPADAETVIAHVRTLLAEPGVCVTRSLDEFTFTAEQERQLITQYNSSPNSLFLIAESDGGDMIGLLTLRGGNRRAVRHEVELVVNVAQPWRKQGVASALIGHAIEWAKGTGVVKRIELKVFKTNTPAIKLYERLGFEVEGVRRKAVFRDGEYIDGLLMSLLL